MRTGVPGALLPPPLPKLMLAGEVLAPPLAPPPPPPSAVVTKEVTGSLSPEVTGSATGVIGFGEGSTARGTGLVDPIIPIPPGLPSPEVPPLVNAATASASCENRHASLFREKSILFYFVLGGGAGS